MLRTHEVGTLRADQVGRPELPVIAAFVGGFVFAKLLGRFGGDDD